MREIKFRAWDGDNMYYWNSTNHPYTEEIDGTPYKKLFYLPMSFLVGDSNDMEWMQYTGLKDKNGKEIYEGDVVGSESADNYKVYWNELTAGFWIKSDYDDAIYISRWKSKDFDDRITLEIIGNIYENPELLCQ